MVKSNKFDYTGVSYAEHTCKQTCPDMAFRSAHRLGRSWAGQLRQTLRRERKRSSVKPPSPRRRRLTERISS